MGEYGQALECQEPEPGSGVGWRRVPRCPVLEEAGFGAHLEHMGLEMGNQAREVLKSSSMTQRIIWTPLPILDYIGLETSLRFGVH